MLIVHDTPKGATAVVAGIDDPGPPPSVVSQERKKKVSTFFVLHSQNRRTACKRGFCEKNELTQARPPVPYL
jgi:hypothetical protein